MWLSTFTCTSGPDFEFYPGFDLPVFRMWHLDGTYETSLFLSLFSWSQGFWSSGSRSVLHPQRICYWCLKHFGFWSSVNRTREHQSNLQSSFTFIFLVLLTNYYITWVDNVAAHVTQNDRKPGYDVLHTKVSWFLSEYFSQHIQVSETRIWWLHLQHNIRIKTLKTLHSSGKSGRR